MAVSRRYLDSCAALGMQGPVDARVPWKMEALLGDLRHAGIHGALVHHVSAREYDPGYGNRKLMDAIAAAGPEAQARLLPCWVVLPHQAGEMPPGPELVRQMHDAGVRAAKAFPRRQHFSLRETTSGLLLGALEEASIPLLLDAGLHGDDQQVTLDEVDDLCARHPRLPVLIQKTRWEMPRDLLALLDRHLHLYVEFSSLQVHYGLEFFRDRVGAERLLLGTDWPFKSPGAARAYVDYCELPDEDRTAVAGGNLARLLRLDTLPDDYPPQDQGRILETARRGAPLDHIPVLDPHTHVLHDGLMGSGFIPIPHGDAAHMIRRNRRLGIDRFACSTWVGIWIDYRDGVALTRELEQRYPDDFIPYASIDPRKSDDVAADVHLQLDTYGWRGLKPYQPRHGLPYNDPLYDPWYERANALGCFVKLHQTAIGDRFYDEIEDLAVRYPNLSLMLAHSGWTWEVARQRAAFAKRFPQVYLDLTFTSVLHGVVEYFCEEGLEDRVLFTTDAPMRDPVQQFGWVVYADVTEEQKEKILGRNALRMFAHAGLPWVEPMRRRYGLSEDFARRTIGT